MIILLLIFQGGNPYPYYDLIQKYADNYNLPPNLIAAIIKIESNFNPKATSYVDCKGLMQLHPKTARVLGVKNVFSPEENVDGGCRHLSNLIDVNRGDTIDALLKYGGFSKGLSDPEAHKYINNIFYWRRKYLTIDDKAKYLKVTSSPQEFTIGNPVYVHISLINETKYLIGNLTISFLSGNFEIISMFSKGIEGKIKYFKKDSFIFDKSGEKICLTHPMIELSTLNWRRLRKVSLGFLLIPKSDSSIVFLARGNLGTLSPYFFITYPSYSKYIDQQGYYSIRKSIHNKGD